MTKGAIIETISFRLREGADEAGFLAAMKGLEPFLSRIGGMASREVSRDAEGVWTDRYIWADKAAADRADAEFPKSAEGGALMPFFEEGSLAIRRAGLIAL